MEANTYTVVEEIMTSDLIGTLKDIMEAHTGRYLPDFDDDIEDLSDAAERVDNTVQEDRTFLWTVYASGTWCLLERNVLIRDSWEHSIWTCHAAQSGRGTLAYRILVSGIKDGKIAGSIHKLDYGRHRKHIRDTSVCASQIRFIYERGERVQPVSESFPEEKDTELGRLVSYWYIPGNTKIIC